jgi:propionate CoA-transferase
MIDQPYQFDFYDGGGLDLAFLSFAQADADGSVNVSRFNTRIIGAGGFQHIAQNAKKVIFSGTFTAGGLDIAWSGGRAAIKNEGKYKKFVAELEQITYNGKFASQQGQEVIYVTERAVFRLDGSGLALVEVAPGIDVERDIVAQMGFRPAISADLRDMDARLFRPDPMGLGDEIMKKPRINIPQRLREKGNFFDE